MHKIISPRKSVNITNEDYEAASARNTLYHKTRTDIQKLGNAVANNDLIHLNAHLWSLTNVEISNLITSLEPLDNDPAHTQAIQTRNSQAIQNAIQNCELNRAVSPEVIHRLKLHGWVFQDDELQKLIALLKILSKEQQLDCFNLNLSTCFEVRPVFADRERFSTTLHRLAAEGTISIEIKNCLEFHHQAFSPKEMSVLLDRLLDPTQENQSLQFIYSYFEEKSRIRTPWFQRILAIKRSRELVASLEDLTRGLPPDEFVANLNAVLYSAKDLSTKQIKSLLNKIKDIYKSIDDEDAPMTERAKAPIIHGFLDPIVRTLLSLLILHKKNIYYGTVQSDEEIVCDLDTFNDEKDKHRVPQAKKIAIREAFKHLLVDKKEIKELEETLVSLGQGNRFKLNQIDHFKIFLNYFKPSDKDALINAFTTKEQIPATFSAKTLCNALLALLNDQSLPQKLSKSPLEQTNNRCAILYGYIFCERYLAENNSADNVRGTLLKLAAELLTNLEKAQYTASNSRNTIEQIPILAEAKNLTLELVDTILNGQPLSAKQKKSFEKIMNRVEGHPSLANQAAGLMAMFFCSALTMSCLAVMGFAIAALILDPSSLIISIPVLVGSVFGSGLGTAGAVAGFKFFKSGYERDGLSLEMQELLTQAISVPLLGEVNANHDAPGPAPAPGNADNPNPAQQGTTPIAVTAPDGNDNLNPATETVKAAAEGTVVTPTNPLPVVVIETTTPAPGAPPTVQPAEGGDTPTTPPQPAETTQPTEVEPQNDEKSADKSEDDDSPLKFGTGF